MASIFLARSVSPASVTMAAFLVDVWAMGLKDAWGRVDISVSEFTDVVERFDEQAETCPMNLGTARHVVHGGIVLARNLGFRLPRKYERWTAILGPLPEGEEPDMSLFCPGGRIQLICNKRDLEARLIGTTPERFIDRPDVDFILDDDNFTLVNDEDDQVDELVKCLEDAFLVRVRQWCFANGQVPHPLLPDVISAMMESIYQSAPDEADFGDEISALSDSELDEVSERMSAFLAASFADQPAELDAAMAQFQAFMHSVDSPDTLLEALKLEHDPSRGSEE